MKKSNVLLSHARCALLFAALISCAHAHAAAQSNAAQTTPADAKEPAVVSGRVTNEGKPAADIPVVLMPADWQPQMKPVARATTDEAGRFKLANVPPGKYQLTPVSPGYVFAEPGAGPWQPGKIINVAAGEELKDLNFTLLRGGVVTGRVTNADGKPFVERFVTLLPVDAQARKERRGWYSGATTDDRGIYRAWGVAPGRYLVYAGKGKEDNYQPASGDVAGEIYPQTFYPSVADEAQAKVVEVSIGSESSDVDITLGKASKTFEASGRVTDADGKPVVGINIFTRALTPDGARFDGNISNNDGGSTDERGEFRVKGLTSGHWSAWASEGSMFSAKQGTTYSDPAMFEITDANVRGLEIKTHQGATFSGVVTIEGTSDASILARRAEMRFYATVRGASELTPGNYVRFQLQPDGGFHLTGLRPGKVYVSFEWPPLKGFTPLFVRRDGVEQPDGIELRAGEHIKGVQIAYVYGVGVVRGQVQFPGGARPAGAQLYVSTRRAANQLVVVMWAEVDALGRFTVEGLNAGEYALELYDYSTPPPPGTKPTPVARTVVNVSESGEVRATLVYDTTPKPKENER